MRTLKTIALASALATLAAADTGGANPADTAADHPDDAQAKAAAEKKAAANVAESDADGDGKLRYRVAVEFHDTTTGRVRRKGRTVKADAERAAVLLAARVINPTPLEADEADDEGEDDDNADAGTNTNAIAPATVGGVVDEAVIVENGGGATVTDGQRHGKLPGSALTTDNVPAVVKGGGKRS